MKKKINRRFTGIAVFSIMVTTFVMAVIFYSRLQAQVFSDLKIIASIFASQNEDLNGLYELGHDISVRVTVIEEDGRVSYDSIVDAGGMDSHLDRKEVRDAFEKGSGQDIRISDTLSTNVFYYAVRMESGQVLRVGKEYASVLAVMASSLPAMFIMMLLLILICMALTHYLTLAIIEPINTMARDLDHIDEEGVYGELVPIARKIRSQHEEILSAANMRRDFTANVSHELKTPLTAISGYAELMEAEVAKAEDVKRFSAEIRKSAGRLLNLINDILKLSKLDEGYPAELLEIVDLSVIARDTVEMISVNAAKMDVSVRFEGCDSAKLRLGKELAEEVTYNLIENAIRYNQKGGKVVVTVSGDSDGVLFEVADTGIGIPKEQQERVFERFYRVDKSRSKEQGLGWQS